MIEMMMVIFKRKEGTRILFPLLVLLVLVMLLLLCGNP